MYKRQVLGTTISLSITAMGAYALSAKRMIGHKFFSMMIVFTMFFQGGMIPTYLVVKSYGLLDTIWAVILPGAVSTWNFIVMRSFFDNYPSEIEESGKVDGLTDAGVFFRLVLPTSKAVLATIGLYYAVSLWNAYFIPFIYLNAVSYTHLDVYKRQAQEEPVLTALPERKDALFEAPEGGYTAQRPSSHGDFIYLKQLPKNTVVGQITNSLYFSLFTAAAALIFGAAIAVVSVWRVLHPVQDILRCV